MKQVYARSSKSAAWIMMKDLFRAVFGISNKFVFDKNSADYLLTTVRDKRTFNYLREKGYIEDIDNSQARFTDLAKINLLAEIVKTRKLDGESRLVVFDIPQTIGMKRAILRSHLKELGFVQWQKSVWISNLPCDDLVLLVAKFHRLEKYMGLFVGRGIPTNYADWQN